MSVFDSLNPTHRILFPRPNPPHYQYDSFPDNTIWLPKTERTTGAIPCVLLPFRGADLMIVFSHGNGCDIGSMYETMHHYRNYWKAHILMWEYPGYGCCEGFPSEATVNANMNEVYAFIRSELKWPANRLVFYGQSIGTGPVCHLVSSLNRHHIHTAGVILQSPYTCIRDVVVSLAGKFASKLISNRWANIEEVKHMDDPILIIHGQRDTLIPYSHSEQLYEHCESKSKHLLLVNQATHNEFDHHQDIIRPAQAFFDQYARRQRRLREIQIQARVRTNISVAPLSTPIDDKEEIDFRAALAEAERLSLQSAAIEEAQRRGVTLDEAKQAIAASLTTSASSPPSVTVIPPTSTAAPIPPASKAPTLAPSSISADEEIPELRIDPKWFIVPESVLAAHKERKTAEENAKKKSMWSSFTSSFSSLSSSSSSSAQASSSDEKKESEPVVAALPPSTPSSLPSLPSFDRPASSASGAALTNVPPSQQHVTATTNGHHHGGGDDSKPRATPAARLPGAAYGYASGDDDLWLDDEEDLDYLASRVSMVTSPPRFDATRVATAATASSALPPVLPPSPSIGAATVVSTPLPSQLSAKAARVLGTDEKAATVTTTPRRPGPIQPLATSPTMLWICAACTFHNPASSIRCDICETPRALTVEFVTPSSSSSSSAASSTISSPATPPITSR